MFFSRTILSILIGSDSEYLSLAISYINYTLSAFFIELQYEVYGKLLETQQKYTPVMLSITIPFILCPFLCIYFIKYLELLGVVGCAIVTNLIPLIRILIMIYSFKDEAKEFAYDVISPSLYSPELWQLAKILNLTMLIYLADFMTVSILSMISATLGTISYAKFIVINNISELFYSIGYSLVNG